MINATVPFSPSPSDPARILVVDDQPEVRTALQDYFTTLGHTVDVASNGIEALVLARQNVFDVIVLDLLMPKMDGDELCRRIKSDPALENTGVIMLTAVTAEDRRLKALQAGADDYLTKPFSFLELEIRVRLQARAATQRRKLGAALASAHRKNTLLEIVAEMAQAITSLSNDDLPRICQRTASAVEERFGYEVTSIFLLDLATNETVLQASAGAFATETRVGARLPVSVGVIGYVCRTGIAQRIADVQADPHWTLNALAPETWKKLRSALCVPISAEGKTLGCILAESLHLNIFEPDDQLMLETLAGHVAVAITNTRLYHEMIEYTTELGVHTQILGTINATRDVKPLFEAIHHEINRIVPHTDMYITRYNETPQTVTFLYLSRPDEEFYPGAQFEADQMPIQRRACQEGKPVILDDFLAMPHPLPIQNMRFKYTGERSGIIVPIFYQENVFALMILSSDRAGAFSEEDSKRLQHLTPHIALAIKQAKEYKALQQAYADLQQAQASIIQAEREKTALDTALQTGLTLSHEINNPLTAIIGFAELLSRETPGNSEYKIILQAGQRIADVVRRLRHLKSVELKSYVTDIPIQMIDLGLPEPSSESADSITSIN